MIIQILNIILWMFAALSGVILLTLFCNYIKNKITYYIASIRLKRIAKKYDGETKRLLLKISDDLMTYSKQETFLGNEED